MVAKGAWLNRVQVVRQARQSNEADVRIAAVNAIAEFSRRRGYESEHYRSSDRDAIKSIALAEITKEGGE